MKKVKLNMSQHYEKENFHTFIRSALKVSQMEKVLAMVSVTYCLLVANCIPTNIFKLDTNLQKRYYTVIYQLPKERLRKSNTFHFKRKITRIRHNSLIYSNNPEQTFQYMHHTCNMLKGGY